MAETRTMSQLESDVVAQREQLARTVDELSAKLDVKAHAQERVAHATERVAHAKDAATTDAGRPRPEAVAAAGALAVLAAGVLQWRERRH